uniref:Uncharacterized protein n=1 Tax=Salmonella enteritidis TaxID=149539 RepID=A0A1S6KR47_SALEN|nr:MULTISPECIES: hypothetical protein [Enterobacteriaceae]AQT23831.1 hypothetical protein [Salmonella enterica subsp. enterica serovar Enteritidis]
MYRNDRNVDSFNLVNALQPVFRNTGCGIFEYDRKKQNETADSILRALALNADFARALKQYVRINSVRRVVQFDDGSVRYGIHAEFEGMIKLIPSVFLKMKIQTHLTPIFIWFAIIKLSWWILK